MVQSEQGKQPSAEPNIREGQSEGKAQAPQEHATQPIQSAHPSERSQELTPKSSPHTSEHNWQQQHHPNVTDWIIAGSTAGILLATVVNVCIVALQWRAMDATLNETRRASDAAAASTTAWIAFLGGSYKGMDKDGRAIFEMFLKNVGKTTALETGVTWDVTFVPSTNSSAFPQYKPYQCREHGADAGALQPDIPMVRDVFSQPYTGEQFKMVADRKAKFFVHGCARYRDVLSDKERITEIGVFYPSNNPDSPNDPSLGIYAPYNRMK